LHDVELSCFYFSSNIVRVMKPRKFVRAELVARTEEKSAYQSLVGKRERKRPCLEGSRKWQDSVKRFRKEGGTRFY